jgi:hypothetical protein
MSRSIQQFPATSSSTSVVSVATNTGFAAGDLVYYQNGDYKGAPNLTLPSSANFPAVQTLPTNPNDWIYSTNAPGQGTGVYGGSVNRGAAVLSNGNMVQAFMTNSSINGQVYFKIIDVNNNTVVIPTLISSVLTNTNCSNVGVLALTSGNFVVYWVNSAGGSINRMCYAIFTNAGASVVAATQDTTLDFANSTLGINGVALPNGGWVLAGGNSGSNQIIHRGYTLAGSVVTPTYSATTVGAINTSQAAFGMAARSDSSFIIFMPSTSNTYNYYLYTAVGVAITNNTISVSSVGPACDVSVLSNGTTFVLAYKGNDPVGSNQTLAFRFLPTGNVISSQFIIPSSNINGNQANTTTAPINVLGLSNGNFICTFGDGVSTPLSGLNYAVFNSSGTAVIATNSNGVIPIPLNSVQMRPQVCLTLLETSTAICVYFSGSKQRDSLLVASSHYFKLDKTTYTLLTTNGVSATVGTSTSAASGLGYGRTTPTAVAVSAAASGTASVQTSTSYTLPPSILYSSTISSNSAATLPNGNFLIAYKDYTTYVVYVSVFSPFGVLLQTITVGTGFASTDNGQISVCALSSGKFVVSYCGSGSGTTLINAMYSSSYVYINSSTWTNLYNPVGALNNISSAGLSNDRFVVVAVNNSSDNSYQVWNSSNVSIDSNTIVSGASSGLSVTANDWGGFYVQLYVTSSTAIRFFGFYNYSGNLYTTITNATITGSTANYQTRLSYSNGVLYGLGYNGNNYLYTSTEELTAGITQYASISNSSSGFLNNYWGGVVGVTGLGNPVLFYPLNTTASNFLVGWTNSGNGNFATNQITYPNIARLSTSTASFRAGGVGAGMLTITTPGFGNNIVLAWADGSGFLQYAIANVIPVSASTTLTAGVSSSLGITVSPVTQSVNSSIIGGVFSGVAATTATAGSTGQVIVNGAAQLNANYTSTSSGVVDHQGAGVNGVRGTFNGRLINMQGNS